MLHTLIFSNCKLQTQFSDLIPITLYDLLVLPLNGFHSNTCQITNKNYKTENVNTRKFSCKLHELLSKLVLNDMDSSCLLCYMITMLNEKL